MMHLTRNTQHTLEVLQDMRATVKQEDGSFDLINVIFLRRILESIDRDPAVEAVYCEIRIPEVQNREILLRITRDRKISLRSRAQVMSA